MDELAFLAFILSCKSLTNEVNVLQIENDGIELIHGDCLATMKTMADKSIDLVLTDPPYGKQWCRNNNTSFGFGSSGKLTEKVENIKWDKFTPTQEYFNEIFRISKNQIIFGGNYFLLPLSNCWLVWDKKGDVKFKNPFADCELVWTSFNKPVKKYTFRQQGFISDSKDVREHPTQKPSELMRLILDDFSKQGDLVLDPFMGSGTTGVACKELDRRFIGVEIEPKYYEMAKAKIKNTIKPML